MFRFLPNLYLDALFSDGLFDGQVVTSSSTIVLACMLLIWSSADFDVENCIFCELPFNKIVHSTETV